MSYFAPYVDAAGLHIPSYDEIRDNLIEIFKSIYGQDCYLENDSADYQWISALALREYDFLQSLQLSYNNHAPGTAIGSGLDQIVKLNGITRLAATYSTCSVYLTGTIGTTITNGVVSDKSGYLWNLPAIVILTADEDDPTIGSATVTAICQTIGGISALIGDINTIVTATYGWTAVENKVAAVVGQPVETDADLRERQRLSVLNPSTDLLGGTISAIAQVENVTRYNVIENPTNVEDADGTPPHSITCVVEGGIDAEIAEAIWLNRGLGVYINGSVLVNYTDPVTGVITPVRFYRPDIIPIYVTLTIYPLAGYTSATALAIRQAVVDYLNALQIGADVTISALYAAAMAVTEDLHNPSFSITDITISKVPSPQENMDIILLYNEVAQGDMSFVAITEM